MDRFSKLEGLVRRCAAFTEMISSEPFAWDVLVEDQYRERQEQAETAEQRDRGKRINVGDRCCRRARE